MKAYSNSADPMLRDSVLLFKSHKPQALFYFLLQLDNFTFHADLSMNAKESPVHPVHLLTCCSV